MPPRVPRKCVISNIFYFSFRSCFRPVVVSLSRISHSLRRIMLIATRALKVYGKLRVKRTLVVYVAYDARGRGSMLGFSRDEKGIDRTSWDFFVMRHAETHLPECYASRDGKSQAASAQQRQSVRILRISLFLVRRISFVSCRRRGVLTSSRTEEIAWQKRVSCDHDFARKSPAHS